jgi:hypothetical protein
MFNNISCKSRHFTVYHSQLKLNHRSIADRKNHIGIIIQQAGHLQYTNDNSDHDHNNKINPSYFAQTAFKK